MIPTGPLRALLEALKSGSVVLSNGSVLIGFDREYTDADLWRANAAMLLDQDDIASLEALLEPGAFLEAAVLELAQREQRSIRLTEVRQAEYELMKRGKIVYVGCCGGVRLA